MGIDKSFGVTPQQALFVKELAVTGDKEAAIKAAHYAPKKIGGAKGRANEYLAKPHVQKAFLTVLEKQGITDEVLAEGLGKGIKATRAIVVDKEMIETEDYNARYKYIELVLKLKGHLNESTTNTIVNIDSDKVALLLDLATK